MNSLFVLEQQTQLDIWRGSVSTWRFFLAEKRLQGTGKCSAPAFLILFLWSIFVSMTTHQRSNAAYCQCPSEKCQTFATKSGHTKKVELSKKRRWEWSFFSRHAAAYTLSSLRIIEKRCCCSVIMLSNY